MKPADPKQEGVFAIIAAMIVLLSAMWNPVYSAIISVTAMVAYGTYKVTQK